jgi:hypothetical protein
MRHSGYLRIAKAKIWFTREEVKELMWLSAYHYDAHCKMAGHHGGFLYGMMNHFILEGPGPYQFILDVNQVSTLAKITETPLHLAPEIARSPLHLPLMKVITGLNDEYRANNPANPDEDL